MTTKNTSDGSDYKKLEEVFRTHYFLKRTLSVLHWDAEITMPSGSEHIRSHQVEVQASVMNEVILNPRTEELLQSLAETQGKLTPWQQANVREMKRMLTLKRALPPKLEGQIASLRVICVKAWNTARKDNNFSVFENAFSPLLECIKEKANKIAEALDITPYEALMQESDPGSRESELNTLFNNLEQPLILLEKKIIKAQASRKKSPQTLASLTIAQQIELSKQVLKDLGFNFKQGRFDQSEHPFTEGGMGDIRITTRFKKDDVLSGLMGTIHECGHSLYDMNLPKNWYTQPVGQERGMTAHEGIALYFEMALARSEGFSKYLAEKISNLGKPISSEDLYLQLTRVDPRTSRIDADEVFYLLHVFLRYEIESMLINGKLAIKDIPEFWNEKSKKYFGEKPQNLASGCLQDIHWAVGLMGYFPSYAKGYLFAVQLFQRFGGFSDLASYPKILENLKLHIFNKGSLLENEELLKSAMPTKDPAKMILSYLNNKYL